MVKHLKKIAMGVASIGLAVILMLAFFRPGFYWKTENWGHRLGGDVVEEFPENTIESFEFAIQNFEHDPRYLYSECDIRETKDHQLIIFHDWDLGQAFPDDEHNRNALETDSISEIPINQLTLNQIQSLNLHGGYKVPTLEEVLVAATRLNLEKPLILEIKLLHSEQAREKLLRLAIHYRKKLNCELNFSSFIRNVNRSFEDPKLWLEKFSRNDFKIYQVYRPKTDEYDLCHDW